MKKLAIAFRMLDALAYAVLTLHSKSSYPANKSLPDTEVATDVMPHRIDSD